MPKATRISFGSNRQYTLDEHGFLDPPEQWDEAFAEGTATRLGIYGGLSPKHWAFIRYLRKKFIDEKTIPLVVYACADNSVRLMSSWRFSSLRDITEGHVRLAASTINSCSTAIPG